MQKLPQRVTLVIPYFRANFAALNFVLWAEVDLARGARPFQISAFAKWLVERVCKYLRGVFLSEWKVDAH